MVDNEILFIFGTPRSGTTYVNALIREFFGYGLASEADFVLAYPSRLRRYGSLSEPSNLKRLANDLCRDRFLQHFRTHYSTFLGRPVEVKPGDILRHVIEPSYPGVVYAVFAAVAEQMGSPRVGNKNPAYSAYLPQLLKWFPRARFLHVIRDGRDVSLSLMKKAWGERSVYSCARKWVATLSNAEQFRPLVSPDRYLEVCYERLLRQPESVYDDLADFLGESHGTGNKSSFVHGINSSGMRHNHDKWRGVMNRNQLRVFEAVAATWLVRYGYSCVCDAPRISSMERIAFDAIELGRKAKLTLHTWRRGPID